MKVTFKLSEREFFWLIAITVCALLRVIKWILSGFG